MRDVSILLFVTSVTVVKACPAMYVLCALQGVQAVSIDRTCLQVIHIMCCLKSSCSAVQYYDNIMTCL